MTRRLVELLWALAFLLLSACASYAGHGTPLHASLRFENNTLASGTLYVACPPEKPRKLGEAPAGTVRLFALDAASLCPDFVVVLHFPKQQVTKMTKPVSLNAGDQYFARIGEPGKPQAATDG